MIDPQLQARTTLDRELATLRDNVLRLSYMVDTAIERAVQSLKGQDAALAQQVIADDEPINRMRYQIEEACYRLLAMHQPTARDMRSIVTAIHIVVELERIGDHAAGIAKISTDLATEPMLKPLIDVPRMAEISREMMRASLTSYLDWDAEQARQTALRDAEVDTLDDQVYRELLSFMLEDAHNISRATHLLWVSHNLERIADRITNICERVVFMVTGQVSEIRDHTH
ncbi:phosphate signaling complex protein PhoU [Aggregatilinea lenta]|uniref:phosphate signaling complex protein PhoU n=1 Tax=Aggregatilinea lenta TaxID=913108 RepID=UPI000E5ADB25|nr:phosphate signaling complex protein PhoU [Aggregatilinea lenta]